MVYWKQRVCVSYIEIATLHHCLDGKMKGRRISKMPLSCGTPSQSQGRCQTLTTNSHFESEKIIHFPRVQTITVLTVEQSALFSKDGITLTTSWSKFIEVAQTPNRLLHNALIYMVGEFWSCLAAAIAHYEISKELFTFASINTYMRKCLLIYDPSSKDDKRPWKPLGLPSLCSLSRIFSSLKTKESWVCTNSAHIIALVVSNNNLSISTDLLSL